MKIINIKEYINKGIDEKTGKEIDVNFNVKVSICNILLARHNQWDGVELLEASKIADKIRSAKSQVILENAEYETVKKAIQNFKGYNNNEVEMVERVLNAKDYKLKK